MARRASQLELYTPRLLSLFSQRIAQLFEQFRAPWQAEIEQLGGEAQRFGGAAWRMITARWPALSELLRERRPARARRKRESQVERAPQPEMTDALIAQLMAASSWQARSGAALSLAHHPGDEVVQALVRAVRDPSVEVAVAAVDALTSHADDRASQVLLSVVQNQDGYFSPVTRVAAVSALAQRLSPEHFAPLFAAVRDIDAEVSIAAAAVISERMPRAQSAQLLQVLRDTSGFYLPIVRLAVANALERAGVLHSSIVQELLPIERDPCVLRVLERASHLTGEVAQLEASE